MKLTHWVHDSRLWQVTSKYFPYRLVFDKRELDAEAHDNPQPGL